VWGIQCHELSANFAEQRIKGLSFREVVKQALFGKKEAPASLIARFCYPRYGFGRIAERMAETIKAPHQLLLETRPVRIHHDGKQIQTVTLQTGGAERTINVSQVVSSIPLDAVIASLSPEAPAEVVSAVRRLRYRDLIIVFLGLARNQVTPDTWMYFPDRSVAFGRMHEPPNWSRDLAPPGKTSLVVEWFTSKGDSIWQMTDEELVSQTVSGLARMGFIRPEEVELKHVVRVERAYPLYSIGYETHRSAVLGYLGQFRNLNLTGRSGLFLYTSSDHYLDRSIKIAENLMGASHDLSGIGLEAGYAEK
jgi:protoporphyrinogen oxidase